MPFDVGGLSSQLPVLLLFGGAVGLLISVMMSARGLFNDEEISPGRRALAHWLPIGATAVVATLLGETQLAVGVLFATSVAALSAVTGFVAMAGPVTEVPERASRVWAFLPAAVTLSFVIGFRGTLGPLDAGLLLVQGVLAGMVWRHGEKEPAEWPDALPPTAELPEEEVLRRRRAEPLRWIQAIGAVALAAIAAYAAVRGAGELANRDLRYSTGGVSALLLSVVLALPMISTGVPLASTGRAWSPLTAQVGVVFLNLTVALPVVIVGAGVMQWVELPFLTAAATMPATAASAEATGSGWWTEMVYPRSVWRIDAVVLLCLSLMLIPASSGKLRFDRQIGGWLAVGYCLYLLAVLVTSTRS